MNPLCTNKIPELSRCETQWRERGAHFGHELVLDDAGRSAPT